MTLETLVCSKADPLHDRIKVSSGCYERHKDHWQETIVLRCRVCRAKRVPK